MCRCGYSLKEPVEKFFFLAAYEMEDRGTQRKTDAQKPQFVVAQVKTNQRRMSWAKEGSRINFFLNGPLYILKEKKKRESTSRRSYKRSVLKGNF